MRPLEERAQADQQHARFKDEQLGLRRLPEPLALPARAAARAVGQPVPQALQGGVPALPARPRVAGPRRPAALVRALGRRDDQRRARRAASRSTSRCCRGCCRTSGCATSAGASTRARAARASRSQPGSVLARKQPAWVMVAELMETSRLWGRTAAQIQPSWIEPLAPHLLKYTYEAPHWERKRGSVVATERATLFGLPVVARPQGRLRRDRPGAVARAASSAARSSRATGRRATSSSPRTPACWRSSRSSSTARGGATSSPATRRSSRSTTRASRTTSCRSRTSIAGGRPRAAPNPAC